MADTSKRTEFHDDDEDWTTSKKRSAKSGSSTGLFIGAAIVLLILVVGGFTWQSREVDMRRAQAERDYVMAEQQARNARFQAEDLERTREMQTEQERLQAEAEAEFLKQFQQFQQLQPPPKRLDEPPPNQPDGEPLALSFHKRAIFCEMVGDLDGAVNALREAVRLDREYLPEFERVVKLKAIRDRERTAPPPRVVKP